jgi:hypothetical protein
MLMAVNLSLLLTALVGLVAARGNAGFTQDEEGEAIRSRRAFCS